MNYGKRLKEMRKHKHITQKNLAAMLNRSHSQISEWETGHTKLQLDDILEICKALNIDIKCFLQIEDIDYCIVVEKAMEVNVNPDTLMRMIDLIKAQQ